MTNQNVLLKKLFESGRVHFGKEKRKKRTKNPIASNLSSYAMNKDKMGRSNQ